MRSITEIKSDKRIKIVDFGFDGMACYLTVNSTKSREKWPLLHLGEEAGSTSV